MNIQDLPKKYNHISSLEEWGRATKLLSDGVCEVSGSNRSLESHHIYSKAEYPDRSLDLDNCIVLTHYLHQDMFHGKFMKGKSKVTTPQDLLKWINSLDKITPKRKEAIKKKIHRLIKKYEHTQKKPKKESINNEDYKPKEPVKRKYTKNGNYRKKVGSKRYDAQSVDEAHKSKRIAQKAKKEAQLLLLQESKRSSCSDIFKYMLMYAIFLSVPIGAMYLWVDHVDTIEEQYPYSLITDKGKRICFDSTPKHQQLDECIPIKPLDDIQLGDIRPEWKKYLP